jgi:hypothetical protein
MKEKTKTTMKNNNMLTAGFSLAAGVTFPLKMKCTELGHYGASAAFSFESDLKYLY